MDGGKAAPGVAERRTSPGDEPGRASGATGCPRPAGEPAARHGGAGTGVVDAAEAEGFLRLFHAENRSAGPVEPRLREVLGQIARHGTYTHTAEELAYGARVAWRNSGRCIGRLYWRSLHVRDRRSVASAEGVALECVEHLRAATGTGRIRPTITVFAQDRPGRPGPRIWNEQLVRYAGYERPDGTVNGDPRGAGLTAAARRLGWPGGEGTAFDVLPLVIEAGGRPPLLAAVPGDAVLEVPLTHPVHGWFAELGLRWHAVPAVSDMCLEIGGVCYPCAPFNGWYMGTEIGARNLADEGRYDRLRVVADRLGLDTSDDRTLWKDHALVELNVAVLHSFTRAGVTITDHHTESRRFMAHLEREERSGRVCPADWSWIVPPLSGAATPVFHRYYDDVRLWPAFVHHRRENPYADGPPFTRPGAVV
ncbi:nitric oxide synthase oxygenase [Sphaerisporangium sp. TRM90804]|uniref:nitric oxide synthase oxygenase n=1 Tax=Sphaerisporangium sp. TRM90804 TaxID=3031113 RepID=UPI002446BD90|nr:nitric oxide synthase oxygenase [Sphaerisporangium sp. TRM90804]MDH2424949.1 nitric oxide synthase oxygenase [Sphaerisporangium sp. TRM90804]